MFLRNVGTDDEEFIPAYSKDGGWETADRVFDFGTNPQIVSDDFYIWIHNNATRID